MTVKEHILNRIAVLKEEKERYIDCEQPDWIAANTCTEIIGELKRVLRFIDNNKEGEHDDRNN